MRRVLAAFSTALELRGLALTLRVIHLTGRVFDALADPNRRYVVEALAERETATATELAAGAARHAPGGGEAPCRARTRPDLLQQPPRGGATRVTELTPRARCGGDGQWMAGVGAEWDSRSRAG